MRPASEGDREQEDVAAKQLGDVQNFYLVLRPHGGRFRVINIGRKRRPDIDGHERNWGFLNRIADSGEEIEEALQRDIYDTKTRGERCARRRTQPAKASMC